jgi:transposase
MKAFRHVLRTGLQLDKTPTSGFCRNLIRDWQCLWHFLRRAEVAPTNNHGERLLRHCVIWRKLSHGTQSENGNRYVERISTVNMTCRLQKKHLPTFITKAVQAFWEGTTAPSLIT